MTAQGIQKRARGGPGKASEVRDILEKNEIRSQIYVKAVRVQFANHVLSLKIDENGGGFV